MIRYQLTTGGADATFDAEYADKEFPAEMTLADFYETIEMLSEDVPDSVAAFGEANGPIIEKIRVKFFYQEVN